MPARNFRVNFANSTPYVLSKISDNSSIEGEWTPPNWQPPAQIQPNQTVAWESESDGFMTGTEGTAIYEIQDGDSFFGDDSHMGHKDHVVIHWDNPWWGPPHSDGHFQVISNTPTTSNGSSTFGGDYADGVSTDYTMPGGGARPEGDDPGPIDTAGWAQIIPGLVALPIPDGSIPHAWSAFVLQANEAVVNTPTFNNEPAPTLELYPEATAAGDSWNATWGDTSQTSSTRLLVTITGQAVPAPASSNVPTQRMAHDQISVRGIAPQAATTKDEHIVNMSPSSQSEAAIPLLSGYTVDVTYKGSSLHLHEENITSSLTRASSYKGEVFTDPRFTTVQKPGQKSASSEVIKMHVSEQVVHGSDSATRENVGMAFPQALTLVLSQNVSLQLYGEYNEQTKKRINYRVRYIEDATDGATIMDVMLQHSYAPPQ
jgi:hypothetical protein